MLPNFLFIGPDKSGSKWLHQILLEHPQCFVPEIADPYFFDRHYDRGLAWYAGLFKAAPPDAVAIGELSHNYLFSDEAADRIARDLPDVKLLVCLRDPVERSFSQYLSMVRAGMTDEPFETAIRSIRALVDNSRYGTHVDRYLSRFPRARFKVLYYDQLVSAPRRFAREVFDFLGVPFVEGLPYDVRVNPAGRPRSRRLSQLTQWGAGLARRWGMPRLVGIVKRSFVRSLVYRPYAVAERPSIPPAARDVLRAQLDSEITRLERLLNVDLTPWREGRSLGEQVRRTGSV